MKLNVWDIGGQRKIRPFWKKYLENTDLLVSDLNLIINQFQNKFSPGKHLLYFLSGGGCGSLLGSTQVAAENTPQKACGAVKVQ